LQQQQQQYGPYNSCCYSHPALLAAVIQYQICDGEEYRSVEPALGSESNPAASCLQILQEASSPQQNDGIFHIKTENGRSKEVYCVMSTAVAVQSAVKEFDFGSGIDGDITLNGGTHTIESLLTGFSWKKGKIPNWGKVTLTNGAVLTSES